MGGFDAAEHGSILRYGSGLFFFLFFFFSSIFWRGIDELKAGVQAGETGRCFINDLIRLYTYTHIPSMGISRIQENAS